MCVQASLEMKEQLDDGLDYILEESHTIKYVLECSYLGKYLQNIRYNGLELANL